MNHPTQNAQPQPPTSQQASQADTDEGVSASVLSQSMVIRGAEIASDEDLVIHGKWLEGKIRVRRLYVAPGAEVSGAIAATEIRNYGHVQGDVNADALFLYKGSLLSGEVTCRTLGVQPGSSMKARIDAEEAGTIANPEPARAAMAATAAFDETGFPSNVRLLSR